MREHVREAMRAAAQAIPLERLLSESFYTSNLAAPMLTVRPGPRAASVEFSDPSLANGHAQCELKLPTNPSYVQ